MTKHIAEKKRTGPTIQQHMMEAPNEAVLILAHANERQAHQWRSLQVEAPLAIML